MTQAQSSLEFIPPAYSPVIWNLAKGIIPFWLRYNHSIVRVEVDHAEELVHLYDQFQQGKMRFMMAFRHPSVIDPPCLAQLLWNQLPNLAQRQGISLRSPVHTHFIYDRGIPLWAGKRVGWGISKLGEHPFAVAQLIGWVCDQFGNYLLTDSFLWLLPLKERLMATMK